MALNSVFLNPGEMVFSNQPLIVKTVLGSCVGICIYDKKNRVGGMTHYLLPKPFSGEASTKYGSVAIPYLIKKFEQNGSSIANLEASILGGSFVLFDEKEIFFVGDKNIEIAQEYVRKYKLSIKMMNTGGETGRSVVFNTQTGEILVRMHQELTLQDLYREPQK